MATVSRSRVADAAASHRSDEWTVDPRGPRLHPELWVLLLTIVGALLRGYKLGGNSLWVDEYATLRIVSLPFAEILGAAAEVNFCPPLYFWSVHAVISAFGVSEASLRLVSAVAGALTIPVTSLLTRELTGSRTAAVIAAALLALNPLHIWYSQEARAYALLVAIGSLALVFLLRALRSNTMAHWGGFVACMTAVLLIHTTGPVLLAVAWGWAILSRPKPAILRRLLAATAVIVLIWLPFALRITGAVAGADGTHSPPRPLTGLELPYTLFTYLVGYSFGPSTREIQNLGPLAALGRHPVQSLVGVIAIGCMLALMLLKRVPGKKYLLTLLLVPIVAMLLGSATSGKAYQARYALAGLVGFCGVAAVTLTLLPRRLRSPATAALLTLCAWADWQWYFAPDYAKDDTRAVVGWLAERLPPGATVAVAPRYVTGVLSHYAQLQQARVQFVAADSFPSTGAPAALLLTRLHHVPEEGRLRNRFGQLAGAPLREDSVGGYQVLSRTGNASGD